jgi:hypothetical protein
VSNNMKIINIIFIFKRIVTSFGLDDFDKFYKTKLVIQSCIDRSFIRLIFIKRYHFTHLLNSIKQIFSQKIISHSVFAFEMRI